MFRNSVFKSIANFFFQENFLKLINNGILLFYVEGVTAEIGPDQSLALKHLLYQSHYLLFNNKCFLSCIRTVRKITCNKAIYHTMQ